MTCSFNQQPLVESNGPSPGECSSYYAAMGRLPADWRPPRSRYGAPLSIPSSQSTQLAAVPPPQVVASIGRMYEGAP